jgi:hypothetical protein
VARFETLPSEHELLYETAAELKAAELDITATLRKRSLSGSTCNSVPLANNWERTGVAGTDPGVAAAQCATFTFRARAARDGSPVGGGGVRHHEPAAVEHHAAQRF